MQSLSPLLSLSSLSPVTWWRRAGSGVVIPPQWSSLLTSLAAASIVGRVNIAVALVPSSLSIVVVSPTRRPLPLSCPRSVHCRRAPLSITVESSLRRPLPLPLRLHHPSPSNTVKELSCRPLPSSRHRAVHCPHATSSIATVAIAVTVAPFIAIAPSIAVAPSIAIAAVDVASRSRLPSPSLCRCTVHRDA
jgi:hypothetical protein